MSQVDILLAEDFPAFREFISRELRHRPDFHVVEVEDGLSAVQQAEAIRPALVLLDIGLPGLDGLSVARRIRSASPESNIVFVTQESEPEIVQEALGLGSQGYIQKTRALYVLPVAEAMIDGRAADGAASQGGPRRCAPHAHQAQFCADGTSLLEAGERLVGSALTANDAAIAAVTRSQMRLLTERLRQCGCDVDRAIEQGAFVHLDADELASSVRADGVADWTPALVQLVDGAIAATARPDARVAIFGACAPLLWASGHVDLAIELEEFGNELVKTRPVHLLCVYPMIPLEHARDFKGACACHGAVIVR